MIYRGSLDCVSFLPAHMTCPEGGGADNPRLFFRFYKLIRRDHLTVLLKPSELRDKETLAPSMTSVTSPYKGIVAACQLVTDELQISSDSGDFISRLHNTWGSAPYRTICVCGTNAIAKGKCKPANRRESLRVQLIL